ncbi:WD40 repeat-like protein [Lepidopterella palustris CBS 459.81]|uniref:WD40 repeat-like protein n=1 Tax=Lepidopterella palustris CBS 459.81 TaxID=1314670 RepID=A0A8E2DYS8_9PEZI|nr:WD40 repeat-like protein [Lepidopterella palustris CBS 459.81]
MAVGKRKRNGVEDNVPRGSTKSRKADASTPKENPNALESRSPRNQTIQSISAAPLREEKGSAAASFAMQEGNGGLNFALKSASAATFQKEDESIKPTPTATHQKKDGNFESLPASSKQRDDGKSESSAPAPVHSIDETVTIQVITGSYERVLHGFTAAIPSAILTESSAAIPTDIIPGSSLSIPTHSTPGQPIQEGSGTENPGQNGGVRGNPSQNAGVSKTSTQNGTAAKTCAQHKNTTQKPPKDSSVNFSDTFLFAAHTSSIRCLAISPASSSHKIILASGSTDSRINLYNISSIPPPLNSTPSLPTLAGTSIAENPRNRELGSLLHHSSSLTALNFPNRSKLISAAADNTISISRARDWTVLSTIKAPIPKPAGRPSGDTAAPGEVPAGVNDFAVHPSMKLMLSVGKGERCMRLWNLVTGKKAGVLNFSREMLAQVGEGKWSSGEGRKVVWDVDGEEFVVGFERGAAVFGLDSKPTLLLLPTPRTKLHQLRYLPTASLPSTQRILALSTEDGRIIFYNTSTPSTQTASQPITPPSSKTPSAATIPTTNPIAQLGGPTLGIDSRIKDFEILALPTPTTTTASLSESGKLIFITAHSDGAVRFWVVDTTSLITQPAEGGTEGKDIGKLIAIYETGHRITCLAAFVMTGSPEVTGDEGGDEGGKGDEDEGGVEEGEESSDSD